MNAASTHPLAPSHNRQPRRRLVVTDAAVHTVWNITARHHSTGRGRRGQGDPSEWLDRSSATSAADPLKNVSITHCSAARWAVSAGTTGVYTYMRPTTSCRTYPFCSSTRNCVRIVEYACCPPISDMTSRAVARPRRYNTSMMCRSRLVNMSGVKALVTRGAYSRHAIFITSVLYT
jgi:hypothetical protein